jgi:hypothetical protein
MRSHQFPQTRAARLLRPMGVVALVVMALTVPVGEAAAASACRIVTLPAPAEAWESRVIAGDPTGRYLIGTALVSGPGRSDVSLLWVDGRLTDFPTLHEGVTLTDVNSAGTIVGFADTSDGGFGFRYRRGEFSILPGLDPADMTIPVAVNSRGDVLGYSNSPTSGARIVVWPALRRDLPPRLVTAMDLTAVDIDDDGTVLVNNSGWGFNTWLWTPDGGLQQIGGPSGGGDVRGLAIRKGWIGGVEFIPGGSAGWRVQGGPVNRAPAGSGFPTAVNRHGDLAFVNAGVVDRRNGGVVVLPGLGGHSTPEVMFLSDRGLVAGSANDSVSTRATVWYGC